VGSVGSCEETTCVFCSQDSFKKTIKDYDDVPKVLLLKVFSLACLYVQFYNENN